MRAFKRIIFSFAVIALLGTLGVTLNIQLRNLDASWIEPPAERQVKWNPSLFSALTFGHLPAAVDWLLIRILTEDPGYSRLPKGVHPPAYYDLTLATDIDPAFYNLYSSGSLLILLRDDVDGALELLLKGRRFLQESLPSYPEEFRSRFWSRQWYLPMLIGYMYVFELDNMPKAAEAFMEAGVYPGAPAFLSSLAKRFQEPGAQYEVGLRLLNFLLGGLPNDGSKRKMEAKKATLLLQYHLFRINQAFQEFLTSVGGQAKRGRAPQADLEQYWNRFLREKQVSDLDPIGGRLSVDRNGRVVTTTQFQPVFGLGY